MAWDETLGGNAFTEVVQDLLKVSAAEAVRVLACSNFVTATTFQAKSKKDPTNNFRALAKLGVAADKAKVGGV